jgi:hypothetical protein
MIEVRLWVFLNSLHTELRGIQGRGARNSTYTEPRQEDTKRFNGLFADIGSLVVDGNIVGHRS